MLDRLRQLVTGWRAGPATLSPAGGDGSGRMPRTLVMAPTAGLEAGQAGRRLSSWLPSRAHINALIAASGPTVVARARYLVRNNGYAFAAVESFASAAVGAGIVPTWKVADDTLRKAGHDLFRAWTDESDAEGLTDFYGQMRRAARECYIAGEVFLRERPRYRSDGLSVPVQLQMLPSEMLDPAFNMPLAGGGAIRQGIEFDRIGRRVAYHFWRSHPGDTTENSAAGGERVRVPASEVIHVLDPVEAGQIRGLTRFSAAMVKLWSLDGYDDAELERKKTAAMFTGFITRADPNGDLFAQAAAAANAQAQLAASGSSVAVDEIAAVPALEPGTMHSLLPGEDVSFSSPAESGQSYEPFQYRTLLQVCMGLGIPYYEITGDLRQANYSSLRAGMLGFRRRVEAFQHSVLVFLMCRAVWRWWLDQAVLSGALELRDYAANPRPYLDVDWITPRWDWVDPFKDIKALILAIENGLMSRSAVIRSMGEDPDRVLAEIADERDKAALMGLVFTGKALPPPANDSEDPAADPAPGDGPSKRSTPAD